jgi:hypothetical protein
MTVHRLSLLAVPVAAILLQAAPGIARAECPAAPTTHKLKFKLKDDQCVARVLKTSDGSDAETLNACEGDTVQWSVSGPRKSIVFEGDAPFDWADSGFKDGKIDGVVKQGAARDGQQTSYKYSVKVEGLACVHDPVIIIER